MTPILHIFFGVFCLHFQLYKLWEVQCNLIAIVKETFLGLSTVATISHHVFEKDKYFLLFLNINRFYKGVKPCDSGVLLKM